MPMPTAGAKIDRPAVPAIEAVAPRALSVAPALPTTSGVDKLKTSQHAVNYTYLDEIYQWYEETYKALANLDDL